MANLVLRPSDIQGIALAEGWQNATLENVQSGTTLLTTHTTSNPSSSIDLLYDLGESKYITNVTVSCNAKQTKNATFDAWISCKTCLNDNQESLSGDDRFPFSNKSLSTTTSYYTGPASYNAEHRYLRVTLEVRRDKSLINHHIEVSIPAVTVNYTPMYTITKIAPHGTISGVDKIKQGDSASFAITADTGYRISNALVNGTSKGAVQTVTASNVQGDVTIEAEYIKQYSLTFSGNYIVDTKVNGQTAPTTKLYDEGTQINCVMTPLVAGHNETLFAINGVDKSALDNTYSTTLTGFTHTINEDLTVSVTNTRVAYKTAAITFNGNATATFENAIDQGEHISTIPFGVSNRLTVSTDIGWHIDSVILDGNEFLPSQDGTYHIPTVTDDIEITVNASKDIKTISKTIDFGTIAGNSTVEYGDDLTLTITPSTKRRIKTATVGGVDVYESLVFDGDVATLLIENITDNISVNIITEPYVNVAVTQPSNGTITGNTGKILQGSMNAYVVEADEGYSINEITVNGVLQFKAVQATSDYSIALTADSDLTISATFTNAISRITVIQPEHGFIIATSAEYINGTVLQLLCEVDEGFRFVDWWNGETDNPQSYTVNGDATISADIVAYNWTITASAYGNGSVVPVQASADTDETLTFNAVPDTGYKFVKWEDDSTDNPRIITVTENLDITATFEKDNFEISVGLSPADAGTVTGEGTYEFEEQVTLTATPTESYRFSHWLVNGETDTSDDAGNSSRVITTPPQNTVYTAVFSKITYDADVSVGEGGSVYPMIDTVEHGSTVNFTFTNKIGYKLSDFRVNGVSLIDEVTTTQTGGRYTLSNITSAIHVEVEFEEKLYSYGRKLIDYYPQVLKEILELIALMNAQEPIIGECWDAVSFLMDNQFIDTATVEGVEVWEKELGIIPNSTDTLKDRKQRLKALWVPAPRYTWGWLLDWLEVACNTKELKEPILNDYTLNVYLPATSDYFNVISCLRRYIPANIKLNPVLKIKDIVHDHYAGIGASVTLHLKTSAYDDLTDYPEKSDTGGLI